MRHVRMHDDAWVLPAGRALVAAMVMALDERDAFLTRGYLVLQLDLPPCFNADLYARAQRQTAEPSISTEPEQQAILRHPRVRAALSSLLGADYLVPGFAGLHESRAPSPEGMFEQSFYCDGTDHGLGQTTARDHKCRRLIGTPHPPSGTPLRVDQGAGRAVLSV